MELLHTLEPVLSDLFLLAIVFGVFGMWLHAVATYDWSKFEEDSRGDDFLKPYDDDKK